MQANVVLVYSAIHSCGFKGNAQKVLSSLPMFKTIGDHTKGECLCSCSRILCSLSLGEHARQLAYFGNPPAIFFLLKLYAKGYHDFDFSRPGFGPPQSSVPVPRFEPYAVGMMEANPWHRCRWATHALGPNDA